MEFSRDALFTDADNISRPLQVIDHIWSSNKNETDITQKIQNHFCGLQNIPCLTDLPTLEGLLNYQTVRYYGLIQDIFNVEYCLHSYKSRGQSTFEEVTTFTKYRDDCVDYDNLQITDEVMSERLPAFCIPIPGESPWCKSLRDSNTSLSRKRGLGHEDSDQDVRPTIKTIRTEDGKEYSNFGVTSMGEKTREIAIDAGMNVLIKIYDCQSSPESDVSHVKLNDMVEIIGIYNVIAPDVTFDVTQFLMNDFIEEVKNIDEKLKNVPIIHCINVRKLCSTFPLYKHNFPQLSVDVPMEGDFKNVMKVFSTVLGGDQLAARYLSLASISRVTSRGFADTTLGSVHLNLFGVFPGDPRIEQLRSALQELVPRVVMIRLDRDTLNNVSAKGLRLFTERNTSTESISYSGLQLGAGTIVIIDETRMTEGPMSMIGVKSLRSLEHVIQTQYLAVEFEYCDAIKVPTDLCFIIFSGAKSILTSNNIINIHSSTTFNSTMCEASQNMELSDESCGLINFDHKFSEDINGVRRWWAQCKSFDASFNEEMVCYVETDFVSSRQKSALDKMITYADDEIPGYSIDGSDFNIWLQLARLNSVAHGQQQIDLASWREIRKIEYERHLRNQINFADKVKHEDTAKQ